MSKKSINMINIVHGYESFKYEQLCSLFINFLKEKDVLEEFIRELQNLSGLNLENHIKNRYDKNKDLSSLIDMAFTWSDTEREDEDYWQALDHEWRKLLELYDKTIADGKSVDHLIKKNQYKSIW